MTAQEAIAALQALLDSAPANVFSDFDVVYDAGSSAGSSIDADHQLWIIQGRTFEAVRLATARAGGTITLQTPSAELAKRIAAAREVAFQSNIVYGTFGKVGDVRAGIENMIDVLKSGDAIPVPISPIPVIKPPMSKRAKLAIAGVTVGAIAVGALGIVLIRR